MQVKSVLDIANSKQDLINTVVDTLKTLQDTNEQFIVNRNMFPYDDKNIFDLHIRIMVSDKRGKEICDKLGIKLDE